MNAFADFDFDALIGVPVPRSGERTGFSHEKPITGATVEWYTPAWFFEELGLEYDLDPCAPPGGLPWIPAKQFYSLPDNGLELPWPENGRIWCNPPYGSETKDWLQRMGEHGRGIALVFARTDTEWFHATAAGADGILFLNQRVRFVDRTGKPPVTTDPKTGRKKKSGPGAGSMLVAWGDDCVRAVRARAPERGLYVDLALLRRFPGGIADLPRLCVDPIEEMIG